jgi:hypothetical protein
MLVLHHLLHVLFTLRGIFMRFPELTYWQDAVPVPCFLLFLCFRKATQEIFLKLDKIKVETPILLGGRTRTEWEPEGGQRAPSPPGGAAQALATPTSGEAPLVHSWRRPSPIKSLPTENPKSISVLPRIVPQRRRHRRQILGDRSLCSGTLPGWEVPPEPSPWTSSPSPSPLLSSMMRRE